MTETEFRDYICKKLNDVLDQKSDLVVRAGIFSDLPYSQDILSYDLDNTDPEYLEPINSETDICIYQKINDRILPCVILKTKLGTISEDEAILLTQKAGKYKSLTSFLRYGIILGNQDYLPWQVLKHNGNIDLLFSFKGEIPTHDEFKEFIKAVLFEMKTYCYIRDMIYNYEPIKEAKHHKFQKVFD